MIITTKYIGPTNTKGARIKVSYDGYSKTYSYYSEDGNEEYGFEDESSFKGVNKNIIKKFIKEFLGFKECRFIFNSLSSDGYIATILSNDNFIADVESI